jgi:HTH-type transcriptional regulator / antitoxin HigA
MKRTPVNWSTVGEAWKVVEDQLGKICFAQTAANFVRNQQLMDELLEATAAANAHPALFNLLDCLSDWVQAYEAAHVPIAGADPVEVLRHLMSSNGLRQTDLKEEVGGQSVVSDILARNRSINAGQAARLAKRFGVSAAVFIAVPPEKVVQRVDWGLEPVEESRTATAVFATARWEDCTDSALH